MSKVPLKLGIFGLAVIAFYTYYANSIPQLKRQPPEEITIEAGATPEQLTAAGRQVFFGKGGCAVCHTIGQPGTRAPDLQGIGARAGTRRPGMSAKAYLIESLINPQEFLVPGFPPIMPPANKPPVGLNQAEMAAVVAFLQSLGGKVDVKLEDVPAGPTTASAGTPAAAPRMAGDPRAGKELFNSKGCVACHRIAGVAEPPVKPIGPELTDIGAKKKPSEIMEAIIDPLAEITPGYPPVMPPDFAQRLTVKELNDLVAFLSEQRGER